MSYNSNKHQVSSGDGATDEEQRLHAHDPPQHGEEIDKVYPNRPHNHAQTLPFTDLVESLLNPLSKDSASVPAARTRRNGRTVSRTEHRRHLIERFFSRWRNEVGNDIYPAMRLILPDTDRDRPAYGLKEKNIGKLLVKLMGISANSEDALSLTNWKVPGRTAASRMAGHFPGRCFEALNKRPLKTEAAGLRIGEVNELLDTLAAANGEQEQLPIFDRFYRRMNPEELQWLIRVVLGQMKIGATHKTILTLWHKDASALFNVCSSLRRVCWDLWDPDVRIDQETKELSLMSNFQPQLASFSNMAITWDQMVEKLGLQQENNPEFWMEEKLDGERMQLHMKLDDTVPGAFSFGFWSRKGKDYTSLYGCSYEDEHSALTRHLKSVFHDGVVSCILDGEMVGFDPKMGQILAFGTLKTAALDAQSKPHDDEEGWRPLFRVFDIVFLNGRDICRYPLSERRKCLQGIILNTVPGRFEIHPYKRSTLASEIELYLREMIDKSAEGLIIKNPAAPYKLNDRPYDWIKVKPDYMTEFGENFDCVIIGAYYGTGRRGGTRASFLCGLRASEHDVQAGIAGPETFYSFFKVGGGMKAEDYLEIQRLIPDDKWHDWDAKSAKVAKQYVALAGGERLVEKPDQWIRPSDSIVIQVKAASVEESASFKVGQTLRFPRFRRIRTDKKWNDALDIDEWQELQYNVKEVVKQKRQMELENRKQRRRPVTNKRQKRELTVGDAEFVAAQKSKLFEGKRFYVPGRSADPNMSRNQLETVVKEHGGAIVQNPRKVVDGGAICLANRENAHVVSLAGKAELDAIVNPKWLMDCIKQEYVLPYEDGHLYRARDAVRTLALENTDPYGDSYYRDVDVEELRSLIARMKETRVLDGARRFFDKAAFYDQLEAQGHELPRSRGYLFRRCRVAFTPLEGTSPLTIARLESMVRFGNGAVAEDLEDGVVTHLVILSRNDVKEAIEVAAAAVRARVSMREKVKIPYIVTGTWFESCWREETLVSEEPFTPG